MAILTKMTKLLKKWGSDSQICSDSAIGFAWMMILWILISFKGLSVFSSTG